MSTLAVAGAVYACWLLVCLVEEIAHRVKVVRRRRRVLRERVAQRRAVFASRGAR
jgi:hypothetical protein